MLVLASVFFFAAAYFATRFPDAPGASAGSYLSTILISLPSFVALCRWLGSGRALASLAALSAFGFAVETVGVATGFPYGEFYYGDALGPKMFGLVPYLLPISYAPLVIGAFAAARSRSPRSLSRVFESAFLLVGMDAVLDPGAAVLGFWVWPDGGFYYGVPISNYLGWLLSGFLASALLVLLSGAGYREAPCPGLLDSALLAFAFWTGVAVFSGLLIPALAGLSLLAYLFHRRSRLCFTDESHKDGKT